MKATEHPAYTLEQRRVTKISRMVETLIKAGLSFETRKEIQSGNDPARVKLAELNKKTADHMENADAVGNPVRARFDIQDSPKTPIESFYIGLKDMERVPGEGVRVLDWRAPICQLFYDAAVGEATFENDQGVELSTNLLLRRSLRVENRRVIDITDNEVLDGYTPDGTATTSNLIADEFLIGILNSPTGSSLREIVGTIQREQHQLIREPRTRPLVVQAVAGSGKSTIALHRLAHILYDLRRKQDHLGKVMVFAPNRVLVKYVSQLLPSLLESDVPHMTFSDWVLSMLFRGKKSEGKRQSIVVRTVTEMGPKERSVLAMKGSADFLDAMDRYLDRLAQKALPRADVLLAPSIRCPVDLIHAWYRERPDLPYSQRLTLAASRFAEWARAEADKAGQELTATADRVTQLIEETFPKGSVLRQFKDKVKGLPDVRNQLLRAIGQRCAEITETWRLADVKDLYQTLVTSPEVIDSLLPVPADQLKAFCKANGRLRRQHWDELDLAAVMYLYTRVYGVMDDQRWTHVIVDEGQDFSLVHYAVIQQWVRDQSVTIVGDLAQGVSGSLGLSAWEDLRGRVFAPNALQIREIKRSYRLTQETLALSLDVLRRGGFTLSDGLLAIRKGENPTVISFRDESSYHAAVVDYLQVHAKDKRTVAVLTPTSDAAQRWLAVLQKRGLKVRPIDGTGSEAVRVIVGPVALAKGLEFDYVVVVDADPRQYPPTREAAKLLYVAITRAKQQVMVTTLRRHSPLLGADETPDDIGNGPNTLHRRVRKDKRAEGRKKITVGKEKSAKRVVSKR